MDSASEERHGTMEKALAFCLYLTGGVTVFLLAANTIREYPTNRNALFEWGITMALALLVVALRRFERLRCLANVAFALLVASLANAVNLHLGNWAKPLMPASATQLQALAFDKVSQAVPIIVVIILVTLLSGDDLGSIFLRRGRLRFGLTFGLLSFAAWAAVFAYIAVLQSTGPAGTGLMASGVPLGALVAAIPWILVFCLTNGFMEELWFRGVSLGKLTPILGPAASVVVTALVFGSAHLGADYVNVSEKYIFFGIVCVLGLINGAVMLKSRSIWGSMLFHAGYDLLTIIPILTSPR